MRPKNVLLTLLAFFVLELPSPSFGQSVSVGIVAGAGLSSDFRNSYDPASPSGPGETDYSTPKRYLVGPMLEFGLPTHISLEVDGLFRPLEYTFASIEPSGALNSVSPSPVITWEFPVLAKYRFRLGPLRRDRRFALRGISTAPIRPTMASPVALDWRRASGDLISHQPCATRAGRRIHLCLSKRLPTSSN